MLSNASRDVPTTQVRLHPVVAAASRGELPAWAVAGAKRREHMTRVAGLHDVWAAALGISEDDRARWRAAGHLHDALRDERPDALRPQVPAALRDLPGPLLHGPAAAERLRREGVDDEELLAAVAFHTTGAAGLGTIGLALYAADYLEPGRDYGSAAHAALRARMPGDLHEVVRDVAGERMTHAIQRRRAIHPGTLVLWNELTELPRAIPR